MTFKREWYGIRDLVPTESGDTPCWQLLGFQSAATCQQWISRCARQGALKVATGKTKEPHIRKRPPGRHLWEIHLERILTIGEQKVG